MSGEYTGGDKDYYNISKIRSVIDKTKDKVQGFINIVTGSDVKIVEEKYGKDIGKAKSVSLKRAGTTNTFETKTAVNKYIDNAPDYAEAKAVYKNGERQAFGIAFTPVYYSKGAHKGEVKEFTTENVSGIITRGGTILKTARSKEFTTPEGMQKAYETCVKEEIDALERELHQKRNSRVRTAVNPERQYGC